VSYGGGYADPSFGGMYSTGIERERHRAASDAYLRRTSIPEVAPVAAVPKVVEPVDVVERLPGRPGAAAEAFLRFELSNGAKPATAIHEAAKRLGIAPRTLARAKEALGITSVKGVGGWTWTPACLPQFFH
jgi:hypothetical protein